MIYVLCGVSAVYALLSILAAGVGMKNDKVKDTHIAMMCGGVLLLAASAALLFHWRGDFILAVFGGASICAAAFVNGKRGENFHLSHHIVRFVITFVLTLGFMML